MLPELPRLVHQSLSRGSGAPSQELLLAMLAEQRRTNRMIKGIIWALVGFVVGVVGMHLVQVLEALRDY
jgi:ubiquinone biosynthesis protein